MAEINRETAATPNGSKSRDPDFIARAKQRPDGESWVIVQ